MQQVQGEKVFLPAPSLQGAEPVFICRLQHGGGRPCLLAGGQDCTGLAVLPGSGEQALLRIPHQLPRVAGCPINLCGCCDGGRVRHQIISVLLNRGAIDGSTRLWLRCPSPTQSVPEQPPLWGRPMWGCTAAAQLP
jgi:hypothetical protein